VAAPVFGRRRRRRRSTSIYNVRSSTCIIYTQNRSERERGRKREKGREGERLHTHTIGHRKLVFLYCWAPVALSWGY